MDSHYEYTDSLLQVVRTQSPLVHNITNLVAMHTTANALLALGASPVMAHAVEEVAAISGLASALVLNIGTLSTPWLESMRAALQVATTRSIPVVIDPVGAGASPFRTRAALELLEASRGAILRGNASEIAALAGSKMITRGVDSIMDAPAAEAAAVGLARQYGCTVCVSGATDLITDGYSRFFVRGGNRLMARVTGMGCTASAFCAAFAAESGRDGVKPDSMGACLAAMMVMSAAGGMAARVAQGPGSFFVHFLDLLYTLSVDEIAATVTVEAC